jgi:hypothetical protein
MKARMFQRALGVAVATAFLALLAVNGPAQISASTNVAPQLTPNVAAIVKLVQAKISDDTIIAYIKNSGNNYRLDAPQIIYLHQQGIADAVIAAMLNQPKPGIAEATVSMPTTPAPEPVASAAYEQPSVTYVESEPVTYYDYEPYYYPVYSGYYWSYPVVVSYGWGAYRHYGGWYGGSWHGGAWYGGDRYRGGWHGGGVVRGGGFAHGGGGVVYGGGGARGGGFSHGTGGGGPRGGGFAHGNGSPARGGGGGHAGGRR